MSHSLSDIEGRINAAIVNRDEPALDQLLAELYRPAKQAPAAFTPAIELKPHARRALEEEASSGVAPEADIATDFAIRITRAKRRVRYDLKVMAGFDGMRLVSEGDSWFQYPLVLKDIIELLSHDDDKAILSLDGAGDEALAMVEQGEYLSALEQTRANIFLLSAGGNDLLGNGRLAAVLKPYASGHRAEDLLDEAVLRARIDTIVGSYRRILANVGEHFPGVTTIGHGYDVPHPRKGGRWFGRPLDQRSIPHPLGRSVIGLLVDRFNEALADLVREFPGYRHIDLRKQVDRGSNSWHDELHPLNAGFGRAADAFRAEILKAAAASATRSHMLGAFEQGVAQHQALSSGKAMRRPPRMRGAVAADVRLEALAQGERTMATIVIDPGHGGSANLTCSSWNNARGPVHGTLEKTLTLDVAQRVKREFERRDRHNIVLTRDRDVNIAGRDRARKAREHNAEVLVSIHFNASTGHNAQGTETFVHTRHSNTGSSAQLCRAVQAHLLRATGLSDRNRHHPPHFIKKAGLCVLNPGDHGPNTAAVLVEVSFMDRADEEERLLRESYKQEVAIAIANGIESHLGITPELEADEESETETYEDAVAQAAAEAGVSVEQMMQFGAGRRHEAEPRAYRGHNIAPEAAEGPPVDNSPHGRSIARMARTLAGHEMVDSANDIVEFSTVDIGVAPDFASGVGNEAAARALLEGIFGDVEVDSFDFEAFSTFINGLGLQHFNPVEFLYLGASNTSGSCAGKNSLPPSSLWRNITKTAVMLDRIRSILGAPIQILSGYRNEPYNRCISGAGGSHHKRFNAIDWRCSAGAPEQWREVARQVRASEGGRFRGGIGFYPGSRFIHIDTRGSNADW